MSGGSDGPASDGTFEPLGPMDADGGSTEDTSVVTLVTAAVDDIELVLFFISCSGPLASASDDSDCSGIVGVICIALLPPLLTDTS